MRSTKRLHAIGLKAQADACQTRATKKTQSYFCPSHLHAIGRNAQADVCRDKRQARQTYLVKNARMLYTQDQALTRHWAEVTPKRKYVVKPQRQFVLDSLIRLDTRRYNKIKFSSESAELRAHNPYMYLLNIRSVFCVRAILEPCCCHMGAILGPFQGPFVVNRQKQPFSTKRFFPFCQINAILPSIFYCFCKYLVFDLPKTR